MAATAAGAAVCQEDTAAEREGLASRAATVEAEVTLVARAAVRVKGGKVAAKATVAAVAARAAVGWVPSWAGRRRRRRRRRGRVSWRRRRRGRRCGATAPWEAERVVGATSEETAAKPAAAGPWAALAAWAAAAAVAAWELCLADTAAARRAAVAMEVVAAAPCPEEKVAEEPVAVPWANSCQPSVFSWQPDNP